MSKPKRNQTMLEYKLVVGDAYRVERETRKEIEQGWVPQGGVASLCSQDEEFLYAQALVRTVQDEAVEPEPANTCGKEAAVSPKERILLDRIWALETRARHLAELAGGPVEDLVEKAARLEERLTGIRIRVERLRDRISMSSGTPHELGVRELFKELCSVLYPPTAQAKDTP